MESAVVNKPKKYEVVEYPVQKVDNLEQKRQESQAIFETLSLEDREKYYEAYAEFVQKAKALGYDRVEEYDVFFEFKDNANGSYATTGEGDSFVTLDVNFVADENKLAIKKTLFHELVGHCLSSKNLSKIGDNIEVNTRGLNFSRFRDSKKIVINKERMQDISYFLHSPEDMKFLHPYELRIIDKLSEISKIKDKFIAIKTLAHSWDDFPAIANELKIFFNGTKEIGLDLNEGVTDYIAINMTTENDDQFWELVEKSGNEESILPLINMGSHLIELNPANLQAWDDVLFDARLTGQPYKIIKFLKDKTGVSITPKELFALDFSKILGLELEVPA
jgi:hypothetical protein